MEMTRKEALDFIARKAIEKADQKEKLYKKYGIIMTDQEKQMYMKGVDDGMYFMIIHGEITIKD